MNSDFCSWERQEDIEVKVGLPKVVKHMDICNKLNTIYETKNHDYGDSFAKVRKELGNVAILVRLYDKVERLKTLLQGGEQKVTDEKVEDTLMDLANYCIMELIEREVEQNGNK